MKKKKNSNYSIKLFTWAILLIFSLSILIMSCEENPEKQNEIMKTEVIDDSIVRATPARDSSTVLTDTLTSMDPNTKTKSSDEDKINRIKGKLNLNTEEVKKKMELKKSLKDNVQ